MLNKSLIAALLAGSSLLGQIAVAAPITVVASPALPVQSQGPDSASPLKVNLTVKKIVLKDDKEQRVDATDAMPGDVLEYRAAYTNVGQAALDKAAVTLPLPAHTTYVGESAVPARVAAANRNAMTEFKSPPLLPQAPGDAIGALRWNIDKLMPGRTAAVSMRVRVDSVVRPEAADTEEQDKK